MTTDTETRTGTYEGMFLVSQTVAASFGECIEHINHLLERADATVLAMKKWDERRLSFEIDKQKRGVYILAYFTCPSDMVAHLERDVVISDKVMRVLVTTAEHLTEEEIAACDDRKGLETEAKFKAEQGQVEDAKKSTGVTLGAPVKAAAPAEEAASEETAPEAASEAPADAATEGDAQTPAAE